MNGSGKWQQGQTRFKRIRRLEKGVIVTLISSFGSFLVIVFAFLIPSFEEQYDRYRSHQVLQEYVNIGHKLFNKELYTEAEKVFERAFELSGNLRLDVDVMRLRSRVFKIFESEEWVLTDIEELSEGDYLFLIEQTKDKKELSTLKSAYGTYLSLKKDLVRGLENLLEAKKLDPQNPIALVNLGNAYAEKNDFQNAVSLYKEALQVHPDYYEALYNLGVLYFNEGDCQKAKPFLLRAQSIHRSDKFESEFKSCLQDK